MLKTVILHQVFRVLQERRRAGLINLQVSVHTVSQLHCKVWFTGSVRRVTTSTSRLSCTRDTRESEMIRLRRTRYVRIDIYVKHDAFGDGNHDSAPCECISLSHKLRRLPISQSKIPRFSAIAIGLYPFQPTSTSRSVESLPKLVAVVSG